MKTPDRSPIKRGLSVTDFEYSPEHMMKNVANLNTNNIIGGRARTPKASDLSKDSPENVANVNSNNIIGGRARTPKASNLSKGFKLDKSKLFSSFDRY